MYNNIQGNEMEEIEMYMALPKESLIEMLIQYQKTVESIPTKYINTSNKTDYGN